MLHLSSERLAELADGEPTIAEAEHLADCATCAAERSAHQRLLTLAGDERGRIAPPLTNWASLSARLREEEILASSPVATSVDIPATTVLPFAVQPRPHRRVWLAGLRVAAGLVFAVGFGALGRMSANANAVPSKQEMVALADRIKGSAPSVIPSLPGFGDDNSFSTVTEALASLEDAQRQYDRAVAFIAVHDSTQHSPEAGDVFRARLAALDEMAETSRQALSVAPTDPVLNQYYISTLGAREVTLRQLGSVLTPGKRMARF
ncbi:MAG TPA: hypothetical protein VM076_08435 [Gemmatimonadaceae bacterium]|nr:hypothetical protein [Gemmatimonadaceae bacterium]